MKNLSILMPFRDTGNGERTRVKDWCASRWQYLFPEAELIVGDDGEKGDCNVGKARRRLVELATRPILLFVDADVVWKRDSICNMYNSAETANFFMPTKFWRTTQPEAISFLAKLSPGDDMDFSAYADELIAINYAPPLVVRKEVALRIPYDTHFPDWGGEDMAFVWALETLIGPPTYCMDAYLHLWHPTRPDTLYKSGAPNAIRLQAYREASGNKEKMQELLDE